MSYGFSIVYLGGPGSSLTEDLANNLIETVEEVGSFVEAAKIMNVKVPTLRGWLKRYDDFKVAMHEALYQYASFVSQDRIKLANQALDDALEGKLEKTTVRTRNSLRQQAGAEDVVEHEVTEYVTREVPQWAVERVLGPNLDVLDALKILVNAGWLPIWVMEVSRSEILNARESIREAITGVLPKPENTEIATEAAVFTEETADAIRGEILGV